MTATTPPCAPERTPAWRQVGPPLAAAVALAGCHAERQADVGNVDIANAAMAAEARVDAYGRTLPAKASARPAAAPPAEPAPSPSPSAEPSAAATDAGEPPDGVPALATATYRCDGGIVVEARFDNVADLVTLDVDRSVVTLRAQPVGSGIAYAGEGWSLRGKGRSATLTQPNGRAWACTADD